MFLGFFQQIGVFEIVVLGFLGLLIFGRRLPEVGKNLGKSIVEFKKGLTGVDDEVRQVTQTPPVVKPAEPARLEDKSAHSAATPGSGAAQSSTTQHHA